MPKPVSTSWHNDTVWMDYTPVPYSILVLVTRAEYVDYISCPFVID